MITRLRIEIVFYDSVRFAFLQTFDANSDDPAGKFRVFMNFRF